MARYARAQIPTFSSLYPSSQRNKARAKIQAKMYNNYHLSHPSGRLYSDLGKNSSINNPWGLS